MKIMKTIQLQQLKVYENVLKYIVLQDKLRHINIFKSLFEEKSILIRQYQSRSDWVHSTNRSQWKDFYKEKAEGKQKVILLAIA